MKEYFMYLRKSRADREPNSPGPWANPPREHGSETDSSLQDGQETADPLARQEAILRSLAARLKLPIHRIYREIVSGESLANRPEIRRMLLDMEEGSCAGVLVTEIERLARGDALDQGWILRAFRYTNVKIITPSKIYDPLDEADEEFFEFGLFMSRREYKTIVRRLNAGRKAAAREGRYLAPDAPYGYERVLLPEGRGFTLKPVAKEAQTVQMIYDLYLHGRNGEACGFRKVAACLDALHIPPRKSLSWSPSSIRDILKNETYTGRIVWQKRREITALEQGILKKRRIASKDYLCAAGLHEAIISEQQFEEAAALMASRKNPPVPAAHPLQNPLSGLLFCKICGAAMTRLGKSKKTPYDTIRCPTPCCPNISSPLALAEEALLRALEVWYQNRDLMPSVPQKISPPATFLTDPADPRSIQNELLRLDRQADRLFDLLETGVYTAQRYQEREARLKQQREALEKLSQSLAAASPVFSANPVSINAGDAVPASPANALKSSDPPTAPPQISLRELYCRIPTASEKNQLLKALIKKAEYQKNRRVKTYALRVYDTPDVSRHDRTLSTEAKDFWESIPFFLSIWPNFPPASPL